MGLTYTDFKNGKKLYYGKVQERFYFNGTEIFKLSNGEFFQRKDYHSLPLVGFFPEIEIFNINGKLILVFSANHFYTFIEKVKVIESMTSEPFTGFEPNKIFKLNNGQIWQQISGPYAPNHHSAGYVKIINDSTMLVDSWGVYPNVILVNNKY